MAEADVPNSAAMAGKAGRYMSIDSGATAVNRARTPSQLSGNAGVWGVVSAFVVRVVMRP